MTKGILSALALVALGGTAFAADLPSRKGPVYAPVMAPIFTWSGFYAGVNAGAAFSANDVKVSGTSANTIASIAAARRPAAFSSDKTGFIGGAQIGYNYQIGSMVLGAETDLMYTGLKTNSAFVGTSGASSTFRQEMGYLGTLRARAGVAFDRFMVYGTGGLAYGEVKNHANFFNAAVPGQLDYTGTRRDTQVGYTIGGGLEYAFTNNLSAKAEYLYYDLGKKNNSIVPTAFGPAGGSYTSRNETSGQIVRAGLNYRFNSF